MGLQSQLNDASSDSIPLLLVAIVATCVRYVRSALMGLAHSMGLPNRVGSDQVDDPGLAGLMVLADQLNLNRRFSYTYSSDEGADCVVCISTIASGDRVRRLSCRHVFHKDCLDSCIGHLSFACPLCRSPLLDAHAPRVVLTHAQRIGSEISDTREI